MSSIIIYPLLVSSIIIYLPLVSFIIICLLLVSSTPIQLLPIVKLKKWTLPTRTSPHEYTGRRTFFINASKPLLPCQPFSWGAAPVILREQHERPMNLEISVDSDTYQEERLNDSLK